MNSTMADSASLMSTSTRMIRSGEGGGKLRPRNDFYLWLFGQLHAKRLLLFMQFVLLMISLAGLYLAADPMFSTLNIPGLDDQPLFGTWGPPRSSDTSSGSIRFVKDEGVPRVQTLRGRLTVESEEATFRRNVVSFMSYFYLISVVFTLIGLRWVESFWLPDRLAKYHCFNPGVLLIGFLISVFSFAIPLSLWSIRQVRYFITQNCFIRNPLVVDCDSAAFWWDVFRLVVLPIILMWVAYLYILYGCTLGALYVWRRARGQIRGKDPAAASFSWSFRDRNTLFALKSGSLTTGMAKNSFLAGGSYRKSFGKNGSWRSTASTDRPTLKKFTTRPNDLNESQSSLISMEGANVSGAADRSSGSLSSVDVEAAVGSVSVPPRGFPSAFSPMRRPLDTVEEETEHAEGTIERERSRL